MIDDPQPPERASTRLPLSIFHLTLLAAASWAVALLFVSPRWALLPVGLLVLVCSIAPFVPRFGFFLPVITRSIRTQSSVALTFDDGPDPVTTPLLLNLLSRRGIRAAFFVTGEKAERHPELVRAILDGGHEIGNHSYSHDVFLMLRGRARLRREIVRAQDVLRTFGVRPLAFRPPVGITNPRLFRILLDAGMICVGFRRRPADFGNRRLHRLRDRVVQKAAPGDILLLHEGMPKGAASDPRPWLAAVEGVFDALAAKKLKPALLSEVLGRPVLEPASLPDGGGTEALRIFYDGLAGHYDEEQDRGAASRLRKEEWVAVLGRIGGLFSASDAVLEIGAGTGRFTLPLARAAGRVAAVDLSGRMLDVLEAKAQAAGLSGIRALRADVARLPLGEVFDAACAFSSLEYFRDLGKFLRSLHPRIRPGGLLYFVTARRSVPRFFTQLGNAMRQGFWLHARSRRGILKDLRGAGFLALEVRAFGLKSFLSGGMLWEVVARREQAPPSL